MFECVEYCGKDVKSSVSVGGKFPPLYPQFDVGTVYKGLKTVKKQSSCLDSSVYNLYLNTVCGEWTQPVSAPFRIYFRKWKICFYSMLRTSKYISLLNWKYLPPCSFFSKAPRGFVEKYQRLINHELFDPVRKQY